MTTNASAAPQYIEHDCVQCGERFVTWLVPPHNASVRFCDYCRRSCQPLAPAAPGPECKTCKALEAMCEPGPQSGVDIRRFHKPECIRVMSASGYFEGPTLAAAVAAARGQAPS